MKKTVNDDKDNAKSFERIKILQEKNRMLAVCILCMCWIGLNTSKYGDCLTLQNNIDKNSKGMFEKWKECYG